MCFKRRFLNNSHCLHWITFEISREFTIFSKWSSVLTVATDENNNQSDVRVSKFDSNHSATNSKQYRDHDSSDENARQSVDFDERKAWVKDKFSTLSFYVVDLLAWLEEKNDHHLAKLWGCRRNYEGENPVTLNMNAMAPPRAPVATA